MVSNGPDVLLGFSRKPAEPLLESLGSWLENPGPPLENPESSLENPEPLLENPEARIFYLPAKSNSFPSFPVTRRCLLRICLFAGRWRSLGIAKPIGFIWVLAPFRKSVIPVRKSGIPDFLFDCKIQ